MVGIFFYIIVLYKIRAVTFGTHGIPVLRITCPVKPVARGNFLSCILMKPFAFAAIPALACNLHSASRKLNEILL